MPVATSTIATKKFELFGGAITTIFPSDLTDASDFRQVPDTQEVLLDPNSDISYVIEILERVDPDEPLDAARYHFNSIAHDNSAVVAHIDTVGPPSDFNVVVPYPSGPSPPAQPSCTILSGSQKVRKFNRVELDDVKILLAVFRVDAKGIDVVFSCNVPIITSSGTGVGQTGFEFASAVFKKAVQEFEIVDFGLFA